MNNFIRKIFKDIAIDIAASVLSFVFFGAIGCLAYSFYAFTGEYWPSIIFLFITGYLIIRIDKSTSTDMEKKIEEAEKEAYGFPVENQDGIKIEHLFHLYSKQIEKYQQETRTRATLSFIFAILSMCAGMGFMFWGGSFILAEPNANHVAAGAAISAIGGGISAYISKTFLDVHKLSLNQLNRYFTQPVINDHIVMAQRLAEDVKDDEVRKKSYEKIVGSITALIDATNAELHKSSAR